ncbi:MAG: hypothetical protein RLZZ427_633 [Pseudomonadota bacterium]|jgi:hypothetical protein
MVHDAVQSASAIPIETALRDKLVHGDALIGTIAPILRHLLANDAHSVFSEEIIARVRGMFGNIARQLLDGMDSASGPADSPVPKDEDIARLVTSLIAHPGLLGHVHAVALEWQLTERLQLRLGNDPVLSPLLQALIASSDQAVSATAMALLAAQARFSQAQRRLELPLGELPGDLLHAALLALRNHAGEDPAAQASFSRIELAVRSSYDESRSRLGLIAKLVSGMGGGRTAALALGHAGVAIFLSALALASGQDRDMAVLSTNEGQLARLALALRAAGLKPAQIVEQFGALHPDAALPHDFELIGAERAAALLTRSSAFPGL